MGKGIEASRLPITMDNRVLCAVMMVGIMLITPFASMASNTPIAEFELDSTEERLLGIHNDHDFNTSDGFTLSNVTIDASNGEAGLDRPVLSWQTIANPSLRPM